MASLFSPFQVRVDPWQIDYGAETPLESVDEEAEETVAVDVDIPAADWRAVLPRPVPPPRRICFVDGIRRLDMRLVVRHEQRLLHGCFGSFAIGHVAVSAGKAEFTEPRVGRHVVLGCNQRLPVSVEVRPRLSYEPFAVAGEELNAPLMAIQKSMRSGESALARDLTGAADTFVVCDGPLSFEAEGRGEAVGYIKRITKFYLPATLLPLVAALPPGARTPLFAIRAQGAGFARLAWFLRLGPVERGDSEMHGLVRLEVHEAVGIERARELADRTAALLPRFAPPRGRDPRAPQNLYPIGALEGYLRRVLGDRALVSRWIQTFVAREAAHA